MLSRDRFCGCHPLQIQCPTECKYEFPQNQFIKHWLGIMNFAILSYSNLVKLKRMFFFLIHIRLGSKTLINLLKTTLKSWCVIQGLWSHQDPKQPPKITGRFQRGVFKAHLRFYLTTTSWQSLSSFWLGRKVIHPSRKCQQKEQERIIIKAINWKSLS